MIRTDETKRGVRTPGSPFSFHDRLGEAVMCLIDDSPEIQTRRLMLRAPTAVDAARIAEVCSDLDVARMTARLTRAGAPASLISRN